MNQLTYPFRRMHEAYVPEGAQEYVAGIMEDLDRNLGPEYTTYVALADHTGGMVAPFSEAAQLLGMAYSNGKGAEALKTSVQILNAAGDIPKLISLASTIPLESGDLMIFERLAKHAQRVEDFRHTPRELVTAEKLEALYLEMRSEMGEVLSICSRIDKWNSDSGKPVRGRAQDHRKTALPASGAAVSRENLP